MPSSDSSRSGVREPTQIVMHGALVPAFKEWLNSRGLHLAGPVHTEASKAGNDLPYYVIGINADHPAMASKP